VSTDNRKDNQPGPMIVEQPYVIMFKPKGSDTIHTHLYRGDEKIDHRHYGLLVCDLVRHVANAYDVPEDDVWEWVDKERHKHTTDITRPS